VLFKKVIEGFLKLKIVESPINKVAPEMVILLIRRIFIDFLINYSFSVFVNLSGNISYKIFCC